MASIRARKRADGSVAYAVLYKHRGQQTSVTFDTEHAAAEFGDSIELIGAERTMAAFGVGMTERTAKSVSGLSVADWVAKYIATRSGVAKSTLYDYEMYLRNDIKPTIGAIPLELLTHSDVADWVKSMTGAAGKTIANKHGLLSAALNAAVRAELIPSNPAMNTRLPRTERPEMTFLSREEFGQLTAGFADHWHPLLQFMALSGARFGEVSALKPSDVDLDASTVRIARARKRTYEKGAMYEVGPTKTKRSERVINVTRTVLDTLDYSGEWLFTNTKRGPLQLAGWRSNVWYPSVKRAVDMGLKKKPRIHDMRHTCASWMIARGVPLPVIQLHLGHESISTTVNLYGHLDRSQAAAAADLIGADLLGESGQAASPSQARRPTHPGNPQVDSTTGSNAPE